MSSLSDALLSWFDSHGRHDLPWQHPRTPYRVWVSEIMLQQTQVQTVIPYFERFIDRFPNVANLASTDQDEVLHLWTGLGYYARARNLHRTAQILVEEFNGEFPRDIERLISLPGIGRSTAGAILALSYGDRHPILDGNVKRVLARYHEISGWSGETTVQRELWECAERHTPHARITDYTQAIMDLGATLCRRSSPNCEACPLNSTCASFLAGSQADYPQRKPKKSLPEKATTFLLARTGDTILLKQRPPSGLWGGLWVFPELEQRRDVDEWCDEMGLRRVGEAINLSPLRHTFTHFRLNIQPIEFQISIKHESVMDSDLWLWYNVREPARVGIAKPVEKLLKAVSS